MDNYKVAVNTTHCKALLNMDSERVSKALEKKELAFDKFFAPMIRSRK